MTYDEALDDTDLISLANARRELAKHGARVTDWEDCPQFGDVTRIEVTNDCDPAEWVECTPAAILAWLGY